jgi:hypothetical protein
MFGLITGLLRRSRTNGYVTGDEQRDSEQGDVQTLRALHFGFIPPSAAADPSAGHIRIEDVGRAVDDFQARGASLSRWKGA